MRGGIPVVAFVLACGLAAAQAPDRALGDLRFRVRGGVAVAYAADGRLGVLGARGITVFDRAGEAIAVRPGPPDPAQGRCALAPDLARALVIEDGRAVLWEAAGAARVAAFRARDGERLDDAPVELADPLDHGNRHVPVERVLRVALAADARSWEIAHDAGWSAGEVTRRMPLAPESAPPSAISTTAEMTRDLGAPVIASARSPDGAELAVLTAGSARARRLRLPSGGDLDTAGHTAPIAAVAAAADGKRVFTGAHDGVRIWDLRSGRAIVHLRPDVPCEALAASADGTRLVAARAGIADVIEAPEGRVLRTIAAGAPVRAVALSPDGTRAALATDVEVLEFRVSPWAPLARRPRTGGRVLAYAADRVVELEVDAQSPDARTYAVAVPEGVELRSADRGTVLRRVDGPRDAGVRALAIAGPHLVAGCDDGTLAIWTGVLEGSR